MGFPMLGGRAIVPILLLVLAAGCVFPGLVRQEPPRYYAEVVGGAPWTDLVVEIDYAPGHAPSEAATTHLVDTLRNVTGKTSVILDQAQTLNDTPGKPWTAQELLSLEKATRRHAHQAPTALLHILYPSGNFNNSDASGVTIAGRSLGPAAVFLDKLRGSTCTPGVGPVPRIGLPIDQPQQALDALERSTLLHESGHAIGLVDNGLPMVREHEDKTNDPAKGGHSSNPRSVMYWQIDTCEGLRQALLQDGTVPDAFDNDDRADLRAASGR
jgi:hypothetical protein